jgi:hypothetical protein
MEIGPWELNYDNFHWIGGIELILAVVNFLEYYRY